MYALSQSWYKTQGQIDTSQQGINHQINTRRFQGIICRSGGLWRPEQESERAIPRLTRRPDLSEDNGGERRPNKVDGEIIGDNAIRAKEYAYHIWPQQRIVHPKQTTPDDVQDQWQVRGKRELQGGYLELEGLLSEVESVGGECGRINKVLVRWDRVLHTAREGETLVIDLCNLDSIWHILWLVRR